MMVRLFCAMVMGVLAASQALAAAPSDATLSAMGLSGLEVMSDSDALAVRGFGYKGTSANGKGYANVSVPGGSAGSQNSYSAKGGKYAAGANGSIAGVIVETDGGHGGGGGGGGYGASSKGGHGGSKPQDIAVVAFSGGFSIGKIKK